MSRFGWLVLFLALIGLCFFLRGSGTPKPGVSPTSHGQPPAPAPTPFDEHLRTIDRAQNAADRYDDAIWRQREGIAKANPESFLKDLEASSVQRALTSREAGKAVQIARGIPLPVELVEPGRLRLGATVVQVEKEFRP